LLASLLLLHNRRRSAGLTDEVSAGCCCACCTWPRTGEELWAAATLGLPWLVARLLLCTGLSGALAAAGGGSGVLWLPSECRSSSAWPSRWAAAMAATAAMAAMREDLLTRVAFKATASWRQGQQERWSARPQRLGPASNTQADSRPVAVGLCLLELYHTMAAMVYGIVRGYSRVGILYARAIIGPTPSWLWAAKMACHVPYHAYQ
jgi:hypothetical protein